MTCRLVSWLADLLISSSAPARRLPPTASANAYLPHGTGDEVRAGAAIPVVTMRDPLAWAAAEGIEFRGEVT